MRTGRPRSVEVLVCHHLGVTDRRVGLGIVLCHACMISLALGGNLMPVFLTTIAREFARHGAAVPNEQMGRLAAFSATAWVISMLFIGPLSDRLGARPFAILGCLLVATGLIGCGTSHDYWRLAAFVMVVSTGGGMLDIVASAAVSAAYQVGRSRALNRLHAFYCIGSALALAVGVGWLLAGWRWGLAYMALAPIPLLTAFGLCFSRFPRLTHDEVRTPVSSLAGHAVFWLAMIAMFMSGGSEMGIAVWLPAHVERSLGAAPWIGAAGLLGLMVFMSAGRLAGSWIANLVSPVRLLLAAAGLTIALILLGGLATNSWVAISACCLIGLTSSVMWPTTMGLSGDRFPSGGGTFIGLLAAAGNLSGIVFPWAMGLVADAASLRMAVASTAVAPLVLLLIAPTLRKRPMAA